MDANEPRPVSGDQYVLVAGSYRAEVASVGASLRTLTHDGRPLVAGFEAHRVRPVYRGAVLVPWPNRVGGGRYVFDGVEHQLALTETDRGNALHGLAAWADWSLVGCSDDALTLRHRVVPQDGYPFDLVVETTYALSSAGLRWSVRARNVGQVAAPYGASAHPYLVAGPSPLDGWALDLPAAAALEVEPDTLLPREVTPVAQVAAGALDFRSGRVIGAQGIDHAYTQLGTGEGEVVVTLTAPGGGGVGMRWDPERLPWVQIHTADLPEPELDGSGLAVEPMTCPPDALRSGTDLVVLAPGDAHEVAWTIFAT